MKKLLLLLVPLVLLISCETSGEVRREVGVEPPTKLAPKPAPKSNGIIVGVIVTCEYRGEVISIKHGVGSCFNEAKEEKKYDTIHDSPATISGFSSIALWELTILTPQGTTYTVYTEFWKDLDEFLSDENYDGWLSVKNDKLPQRAPEPQLGDTWPPITLRPSSK
jgi:hypothetical protein